MSEGTPGRDSAVAQLWRMTLIRLAGVVMAIGGVGLVGSAQGTGPGAVGGLALMLAGALVTLFGPRALTRRQKP